MGLESVEIVMKIEETFSIDLPDEALENMTTPAHLISYVCSLIECRDDEACLSQKVFHQLRRELLSELGLPKAGISPGTRLGDLLNESVNEDFWKRFREKSSLTLPASGFFCSPWKLTVRQLIEGELSQIIITRPAGSCWSRQEIRHNIRAIISEQLNISDFSDDEHFVNDLGMD